MGHHGCNHDKCPNCGKCTNVKCINFVKCSCPIPVAVKKTENKAGKYLP